MKTVSSHLSHSGEKEARIRREPLTRERVLTAALEIVDRDGLTRLSMRRLGAELGVDPMAVYYHIPNKAALLDAIVEAVLFRTGPVPSRPTDFSLVDWTVTVFTNFWLTMLEHPNALELMDSRPISGPAGLAAGEAILNEFERSGMDLQAARQALMLLTTISIALAQTRHARAQFLENPARFQAMADCGVEEFAELYPKMQATLEAGSTKDWRATLAFTIRSVMNGLLAGDRPQTEPPLEPCDGLPGGG